MMKNLYALRTARGWSQQELAVRLGVRDRPTAHVLVCNWERGHHWPRVPLLIRMGRLFGVSVDCLLDLAEIPVPETVNTEEVV